MDRETILDEIRKNAAAHGGQPVGSLRFARETGIRECDWAGKFWARWSDALREAGFGPNALRTRFDEDMLISRLIATVRALGRVPTFRELQMRRHLDASFPSTQAMIAQLGTKRELWARVRAYCRRRPEHMDVLDICETARDMNAAQVEGEAAQAEGRVYLLRSGRYYKIGRTNCLSRRTRELAIQLPERATVVHSIVTDDPVGIEAYWHRRFAAHRKNGEFFVLAPEDVRAFKRWRRI